MPSQNSLQNISFLKGGGEMGELIRTKDWSKTSVGNPDNWPQSLRTTLSIILNSKFPMFLFWGKDHICFYNDAYRPSLGNDGKHPAILGSKGEDFWKEIWKDIKPLIDNVLAGGEANWSEDQLLPIYRNGEMEDVYWTFSYSAVNDETGKPAGVFVTCNETTKKVHAIASLKESEEKLKFTLDAAELAIWNVDLDTNKLIVNPRFKKWFGYTEHEEVSLESTLTRIPEHERGRVIKSMEDALNPTLKGNFEVEHSIINPVDKSIRIILGKGKALFNENNIPYSFSGTGQDITEKVIARRNLEENEAQLRFALEGGNLGHFDSYPQKGILNWSLKAKQLFGLPLNAHVDMDVYKNLIHPDNFLQAQTILTNALEGKTGEFYENEYKTIYDRWLHVKGKIQFDKSGKAERITGVIQDITETKLAAQLLAASEYRFSNMIYSSPSLISILKGEDFIIEIANDPILETWGKGRDVFGKPFLTVLPEIIEQGFDKILKEVYTTGVPFEAYEMPVTLIRNGKPEERYFTFIYQVQRDVNGKIDSIAIIATDVTQQAALNKKLHDNEKQIKETKEQLELTFANVPAAIFLYGKNKDLLFANERAAHLLDYKNVEELLEQKNYVTIMNKAGENFYVLNEDDKIFEIDDLPTSIALESNKPIERIFSLQNKQSGEKKWLLNKSAPIIDADGNISMVLTTSTDITAQKLAEETIRNSEKRFRSLADEAPMWVWITDTQINIQYANIDLLRFVGIKHYTEFTGQVWQSSVYPDDLNIVMNHFQNAVAVQSSFEFEARIKNAHTNNYEWFYIKAVPHIENEIFTGFIGTAINIQDKKAATEILEYRKALLESNNEASLDGVLLVDAKGNIISYNKRFIEIWNMPLHITESKDDNAALEYAMGQLIYPEKFIEKVKYLYDHPTETSKDELEYKDGKIVERYGYPVIGEDGTYYAWSWIFRDITQQKNDEKIIKESESRFRLMAETLPQLIWVTDEKGNREYESGRWQNYTGKLPEGNTSWEETVHPNDLVEINNAWKKSLETGNIYKQDVRLKSKNGEYKWFSVRGEPVLNADDKIIKWVGAFTDVHTEKTFAQELKLQVENRTKELAALNLSLLNKNESLSISESFNRALTEVSPNVVYIFDIEKNIPVFLNKTALDILGHQWNEISTIYPPLKNIVHPDDIRSVKLTLQKMKSSAVGEVVEHEYRIKNKEGKWIPFLVRETAFKRNDKNEVFQVLGIGVDITELKKSKDILEQKNAELEKMNTELQSFAYISSHDLQEPLRKIQTFTNYIIDSEKDNLSEKGKDYFGRMQTSAARMRQLIDDLLAYSRASDTTVQFENVNLNKFINEIKSDFLEDTNLQDATIEVIAPCNATVISFQFRQLISNLISNALKFKKSNVPSHIKITCKIVKGSKLIHQKMEEERNYCHIKIADNGIGFENRYSEKIFEVFQRLHGKAEYDGTGIGLAIVKKIVDNHHGIITAIGKKDKGAIFDLYLPQ
jgi:PAS domain S-box-containing protein